MTVAKPKPMKQLAGTYRRDRDPAPGLDPPVPGRMWPAPPWMDDRARRVWRRLGGELRQAGLLTELDREVFQILCVHLGRWAQIQEALQKAPLLIDGGKNPLLTESRILGEAIRKAAGEFGLTPSARARALATAGGGAAEPVSLADILYGQVFEDKAASR